MRYWEREFSQLRPQKNRAGNRVYTRRDLAILRVIQRLLRDERYTVAGAREFLKQHGLPEDVELMVGSEEVGNAASKSANVTLLHSVRKSTVDVGLAQDVIEELRSIASSLRLRLATT